MKPNTKVFPRVLIISNNSLSETNNNGKTLGSFFKNFKVENIAQLYFSSEVPSSPVCNNYFRISDLDIIQSVVSSIDTCGKIMINNESGNNLLTETMSSNIRNIFKNSQFVRLVREVFWIWGKWENSTLNEWLENFSPEVIFLCAGDSLFAYRITEYIHKKFNCKLTIYITDDYILPRKTLNPFWWIRRNLILSNLKDMLQRTDLFVTISEKMRSVYFKYLGKDSIIALNMTDSFKDNSISKINDGIIRFIYTGGLHFRRYETLALLAKAIEKINQRNDTVHKLKLCIYSNTLPSKKILRKLNIPGASEYCGSLNPYDLKKELNLSDIPVHVESFSRRSIESTRLSISTKIPEYLSLSKPVLAIGPIQVASMEYLSKVAYCITDISEIEAKLHEFVNNERLQKELALLAYESYLENNLSSKVCEFFENEIIGIVK